MANGDIWTIRGAAVSADKLHSEAVHTIERECSGVEVGVLLHIRLCAGQYARSR
jgi:hypothetical protein